MELLCEDSNNEICNSFDLFLDCNLSYSISQYITLYTRIFVTFVAWGNGLCVVWELFFFSRSVDIFLYQYLKSQLIECGTKRIRIPILDYKENCLLLGFEKMQRNFICDAYCLYLDRQLL